jgi:hypothetical protein
MTFWNAIHHFKTILFHYKKIDVPDCKITMSDNNSSDLESDSDKKINSFSSSTNTTHEYDGGATTHDDDDDIVDKGNNPASIKKQRLYSLPQRRANTSNSNHIGAAAKSPSHSLSNLKKTNSLKRKAKLLLLSKKGQNSISDIEKEVTSKADDFLKHLEKNTSKEVFTFIF